MNYVTHVPHSIVTLLLLFLFSLPILRSPIGTQFELVLIRQSNLFIRSSIIEEESRRAERRRKKNNCCLWVVMAVVEWAGTDVKWIESMDSKRVLMDGQNNRHPLLVRLSVVAGLLLLFAQITCFFFFLLILSFFSNESSLFIAQEYRFSNDTAIYYSICGVEWM